MGQYKEDLRTYSIRINCLRWNFKFHELIKNVNKNDWLESRL